MLKRDLMQQVKATASGQFPFAAIVGCVDSRVSNELIFDLGIGDILSLRVTGNVVKDILGSLEFFCAAAGAKLIVALGHTECGAVKGACDDVAKSRKFELSNTRRGFRKGRIIKYSALSA